MLAQPRPRASLRVCRGMVRPEQTRHPPREERGKDPRRPTRQRLSLAECRETDPSLCDAAEDGQKKRNWLVHSEFVPSEDGLFAALAKPASGRPRADMGRFKVEQINRLAARFVWVSQAITYVLNTDEDGHVANVDPLGTPPPPVDLDWSPSTTPWVRESEIPAVGPQRSSRDASLRLLVTLLTGGATGAWGITRPVERAASAPAASIPPRRRAREGRGLGA